MKSESYEGVSGESRRLEFVHFFKRQQREP